MPNPDYIVNEATKLAHLNREQLLFLLAWCGEDQDMEFGFQEARGLEQQLEMAVEFYLRISRDWQNRVLCNATQLDFITFFEDKAVLENIKLPSGFRGKIERMNDEF